MAKVIRELAAKLSLQAESFNNGIRAAQKEMKEFEKNLKPSLTLAKDLGTGMAAAGGAVVVGMLAATKSAVDFGDALNDARQRTGIAVETLARFGFAAEQSGSSVAGLGTGLKFLAKNMEGATGGGKAQIEAFAELGISAGQLAAAHGDVNQIMLLTADRFAAMEDGSEKTALALKIFGKSGADLIPMLNEGSAGLKVLGDQAQAAGLVINQNTAAAADKLNDSINELKASVLGASLAIAEPLVPIIQSLSEKAVASTQAFSGFAKQHQSLTVAILGGAASFIGFGASLATISTVAPKIKEGLVLATSAASAFGSGLAAMAATSGPIGLAIIATGALVVELVLLGKAWRDSRDAQNEAAAAMVTSEQSAIRAAKTLKDTYGVTIERAGKTFKEFVEAIAEANLKATVSMRDAAASTVGWSDAAKYLAAQIDAQLNPKMKTLAELTADVAKIQKTAADAAEKLATKIKAEADALKTLNDGFRASLKPADDLWVTLDKLNDTWSNTDIIKVYGGEIIRTVEEQKKHLIAINSGTAALYKMAIAAASVGNATAAIKIPALPAFANPTPADKLGPYGVQDPLGLYSRGSSLSNIAAQPALPSAMNLGGSGPSTSGANWPGGFPGNGTFYWPESPRPQGTSSFSGNLTVNISTNQKIDAQLVRTEVIPLFMDAMKLGIGREELTGIVKGSMNGVTSTKV